MAKPSITTRAGKGSALTYAELDSNFENLRDATVTVAADGNTVTLDLNDTLTLNAGDNITFDVVNNEITVNGAAGSSINYWSSFTADSGSASANTEGDSFSIVGGPSVVTSISGDELTVALDSRTIQLGTDPTIGDYLFAPLPFNFENNVTFDSSLSGTYGIYHSGPAANAYNDSELIVGVRNGNVTVSPLQTLETSNHIVLGAGTTSKATVETVNTLEFNAPRLQLRNAGTGPQFVELITAVLEIFSSSSGPTNSSTPSGWMEIRDGGSTAYIAVYE